MKEKAKDSYFITAYDAANDDTLYLELLRPNIKGIVEAVFTPLVCAGKRFDSLADAQAFCKILVSNYVKNFKLDRTLLPDDIKNTLEVAMCITDCRKYTRPFPIWSIN